MENEGKEFIEFDKKQYNSSIYKYCYKHFFIDNKYYRNNLVLKYLNHTLAHFQRKTRIKRKPPYPLYHGSALFSITNQFANYIVNIKDEIINDYKNTLACDEVFLQSIVMQSKFKDNIYKFEKKLNGNLRYIDKNTTDRQKNSPYVFKFKDFDRLMQLDSDLIFARKFSENEDMEIVMSIKSAVLSNSR